MIDLYKIRELMTAIKQKDCTYKNINKDLQVVINNRINLVYANKEVFVNGGFDFELVTKPPLEIRCLNGSDLDIQITDSYMRIGGQHHTHEKWDSFDDNSIKAMGRDLHELWKENKDVLLKMCVEHTKN